MKKKADNKNRNQGIIERFCSAQENKAKVSLIIAAAVFVATVGSVCAATIRFNTGNAVPSENMELNVAEQYLSNVSENETEPSATATTSESQVRNASLDNLKTKRGNLTGNHVVALGELKSLSDEELVDAIVSGTAGVIDRGDIETDQSQNQEVVHQGPEETDPTPPPEENDKLIDFELGIDISEFNGSIDWNAVKADGISFAFIRCGGRGWGSSGKIYEDNRLAANVANAKAAGIKVGVYFFSQAITPYEALEEASFTLDLISGLGINLPVVMDWETGSGYRTWELSGQDFANVITAYCSTIAQNGYTPCVYLNTSDINNRLGSYSGSILSQYKLWYAYPYSVYDPSSSSYEHNYFQAGDTIPPRSYYFEYWQYSWHGRVSGISTDVDLNLRILGSTTLSDPKIELSNTSITSTVGQKIDPMDGVTATSSQDQDKTSEVKYEIKDSSNKVVTLEKAQQTLGKYTITYTFTDSFRGTVTVTATWEVTEGGASSTTPNPSPAESSTETQNTDSTEPSATESETELTVPSGEPVTETPPTGLPESNGGNTDDSQGNSVETQ